MPSAPLPSTQPNMKTCRVAVGDHGMVLPVAWHIKLRLFAHCIPANPGRHSNPAEHRKAAVSASVSSSIKSAAVYTVASSKACGNRATSVMPGV